jgi:hypothetical protein
MSKFNEIKNNPLYFPMIQGFANDFPFGAKSRQDKHSNYQSILCDLLDPAIDLSYYAEISAGRLTVEAMDVEELSQIHSYSGRNLELVTVGESSYYKDIISVKTDTLIDGKTLELVKCNIPNEMDLRNRLALEVKSIETMTYPFEILDEDNNKFLIFVKERCFVGFQFSSENEEDFAPEKFIYRNIMPTGAVTNFYSIAFLKDVDGQRVQDVLLLPDRCYSFPYPVEPGVYSVDFDLHTETLLDNFNISLTANNTFSKYSKKIPYDVLFDSGRNVASLSFFKVGPGESDPDSDYLILCDKQIRGTSKDKTFEAYTLLDENSVQVNVDDFFLLEKVIYILGTPRDENGDVNGNTKLYMYNSFLEGNKYIYTGNDSYLIDLVCDSIEYIPGDNITIETRAKGMYADFDMGTVRLKVENSESEDVYYINADGGIVDPADAERTYRVQEIRWNLVLNNIGSYRITCEALKNRKEWVKVGCKLLTVPYKIPYKVFQLDDDYSNCNIGYTPDKYMTLSDSQSGAVKKVTFFRDGYYFDNRNNKIWTNFETDNLIVEQ